MKGNHTRGLMVWRERGELELRKVLYLMAHYGRKKEELSEYIIVIPELHFYERPIHF
jgi:hypothetical protein